MAKTNKMGLTIQQVSQAGELLVASEINLHGASAAQFSGNMPGIDLVAIDVPRTRLVGIQVKTRTSGQGLADQYPARSSARAEPRRDGVLGVCRSGNAAGRVLRSARVVGRERDP